MKVPPPIPANIPANIWARLVEFLEEGRTGEVVLNVHAGTVQDASFRERVRSENRQKRQHQDWRSGSSDVLS